MDEGEADLALVDVHSDDPHLGLHARPQDVLGGLHLRVGELGDVQQSFELVIKLDEGPEAGGLGDEAREQVTDVELVGDVIDPGIGRQLLHPQGDALLLLVRREDGALHLVTLLDDLGGVRDLLCPAHVRDVEQAVYALLDLHEGSVGGQVADRALDDRAGRVVVVHQVPGIGLGLLHTERDLLLVVIDREHHDAHLLPAVHELRGVVDAPRPGHLGDVYQALDPVLELHESAVGHDVDDLALLDALQRVARLDPVPGRGAQLLEAQSDALAVAVDPQHHDLDLLVHLHHLGRMVDAPPGHVGDVQQTVDAAQVHEDPEVGDVLDHAGADLLLRDLLEQVLLEALAFLFQELAARDHDVHALRIDLDDPRPDRLIDEGGDVLGAPQVDLAGGQEDVDALHIHEQAALDLAHHDAVDLVALVVLDRDPLPGAQAIRATLGDVGGLLVGVLTLVEDLELLPGLRQYVAELAQGHVSLGLAAEAHHDRLGVVIHRFDGGDDHRPRLDVLDRLEKSRLEVLVGSALEGRDEFSLDLLLGEVVALKEPLGLGHGGGPPRGSLLRRFQDGVKRAARTRPPPAARGHRPN